MYIHLLNDLKFAGSEIAVFEKFFPSQSLYVFTSHEDNNANPPNKLPNVPICYVKPFDTDQLLSLCVEKIDCVLVYSALYDRLHYVYGYPLYDYNVVPLTIKIKKYFANIRSNKAFKIFANTIDSFCFWNPNDFRLMQKYFGAKQAQFRCYGHGLGWPVEAIPDFDEKDMLRVQVNHSASLSCNHMTILKKLEKLDSNNQLQVFLPLNYGVAAVKKQVKDFASHSPLNCNILTEFLPLKDYYAAVAQNGVAIFGSRRQEAGGNIVTALRNGVKVYLRNDNNLLQLYRSWGVRVFSFEDDLNSMEDLLEPLTRQQMIDNYKALTAHLSSEVVTESMSHFFD